MVLRVACWVPLEKLASEADGKFTLVKAETEQNTAAAGEFSVGGIPAVFAVVDGRSSTVLKEPC